FEFSKAQPVYETHPGWEEDITHVRRWNQLPVNARRYLKRIEALMETPIKILSVGSKRNQTIFL
ncbi:MAG TPA: adenylosuccinate synthetase, partial [Candidatus Omnitrophota bacterium]|nr:adenylosuccinate synthetase [Candidatus Omnitrophota bacterium]